MTMPRVTLTFDDGLDGQLDEAIPILDRHGLSATFFLTVGSESFLRRHDEWRSAAKRGHELGNHTIFHPAVSSKSWVTEGIAIESYSLDRMRRELAVANGVLGMLDGRSERTFAFPCSNPFLGHRGIARRALGRARLDRTRLAGWVDRFGLDFGARLTDFTPLVRELFVAARCGGLPVEDIPAIPENTHRIRGVEGDGLASAELNRIVDVAIERNVWLVLVFHGIDGEHHLSCTADAFEALVRRLASDSRVEAVTFLEGAKRSGLAR